MFKTRLHLRFEYVVVISMVDKSTELKERRNARMPERWNAGILKSGTQNYYNPERSEK